MITSIQGTFTGYGIDWVEITISGVTLKASVPHSAIDSLGPVGKKVRLFTSMYVRDDSMTLYGFHNAESRSAFEALTAVNGVGPRGALNVLSSMSPDTLGMAIETGDTDAFKGVHGVGLKTASRIVLELKGKLDMTQPVSPSTVSNADLIDALTSLGYTIPEVMQSISSVQVDGNLPLEERIRITLQAMGGR